MRKRIVIRGADIGFSEVFDLGAFKAVDAGIVSCLDVMLDGRSVVKALNMIKERPWISYGWHRHFWNRPVCDPKEVPSLVDESGRFRWGHKHKEKMAEATYEDARKEFEAELQMAYEITGRYPDATNSDGADIPFENAFLDVCRKYDIAINIQVDKLYTTDERYRDLDYHMRVINPLTDVELKDGEKISPFDLKLVNEYDPAAKIINTNLNTGKSFLISCHPGYLDDIVLAESRCNIHRVKELQGYLDPRVKNWIIENDLELVNQRDILFGTNEYQEHLRIINSPLWTGNYNNESK